MAICMTAPITLTQLAKETGRTVQYLCRLVASGEIKSVSKSWKKNYVDRDQALEVLATKQKRSRRSDCNSLEDLF